MPSYDFKNTETEEVTEYFMSHTKLEEFKKANPLLKQVLSAPNFITRRDGDVLKAAGAGWNEVLQKVGEAHPDSKVASFTLKAKLNLASAVKGGPQNRDPGSQGSNRNIWGALRE